MALATFCTASAIRPPSSANAPNAARMMSTQTTAFSAMSPRVSHRKSRNLSIADLPEKVDLFIGGKRVAVVGVSRSGKKFGNVIYSDLKERGYQVFPVNASVQEIDGETCYPNITALKGQIDGAVICVSPDQSQAILKEAAEIGLKNIWLQQGAETPETVKLGQDLGLNMVSKKCILMYAPPVRSFHAWHRAIARLFGQL